MAQELLSTFGTDLGEVALSLGTGGVFEITYDGVGQIGRRLGVRPPALWLLRAAAFSAAS